MWYNLEQNYSDLQKVVWELQQKQLDMEQHSRCANIEVVGVPTKTLSTDENIYVCLENISKAINIYNVS